MIENMIVACCMRSEKTYNYTSTLITHDDFEDEAHKSLFCGLRDYYLQRNRNVKHSVAECAVYLISNKNISSQEMDDILDCVAPDSGLDEYINSLISKSKRKNLLSLSSKINLDVRNKENNIDDLLDYIQKESFRISSTGKKSHSVKLLDELLIDFLTSANAEVAGMGNKQLTSGFGLIDDTMGGLVNGSLNILTAGTSVGKTTLALNIANHVALKLKRRVDIFSLEMTSQEIFERLITQISKVPNIRKRTATDLAKIGNATKQILEDNRANYIIHDESTHTPRSIRRKLIGSVHPDANPDLGLIIIDYLQLLGCDSKEDTKNDEIGEITKQLKQIAKDFNVPVLALAQINREMSRSDDKTFKLRYLRGSGNIEQDANTVLFLDRDITGDYSREATLYIAKNRGGINGVKSTLYYDGSIYTFKQTGNQLCEPRNILQ